MMSLPADHHVHTEWSWDAQHGSMERTCARAVAIGLPAVAFTEHADFSTWLVAEEDLVRFERLRSFTGDDLVLRPPSLDLGGYQESIERCRRQFADLRILSGVELGEPHRHRAVVDDLLASGGFDRVLGSLHSLPAGAHYAEMSACYRHRAADDVLRDYLSEIADMITRFDGFSVLAHLDYPVRYWPTERDGSFEPSMFEEEFRHALRTLAGTDRALEINTNGPLHPELIQWWADEGGRGVTFGSDAHDPSRLAQRFGEATTIAETCGFRPGRHPYDFWWR